MKKYLAILLLSFGSFGWNSCSDLIPDINLPLWSFDYEFWINPETSGNQFIQDQVIDADIKSFLEENGVTFDPEKVKSVKLEGLDFEVMSTDPDNPAIDFSYIRDVQSSIEITGTNPRGPEDVATYPGEGPAAKKIEMAVNNDLDLKDYFLKESTDTLKAKASGSLTKDINSRVQMKGTLRLRVTL